MPTGFRFRHSQIQFRRQVVLVGGAKSTEKARSAASGLSNRGGLNLLLQHMRGITACVRACDAWGGIHIWANCIGCVAGRASRHHVAFDVLLDFGLDNRVEVLLALLDCPLLDRTVYLSHVVDTRVRLRRVAGLDEVGNRNRRQHANDGHHNHDFHQREARVAGRIDLHNVFLTFLVTVCGVNTATGGLFIITVGVHSLPVATAHPG